MARQYYIDLYTAADVIPCQPTEWNFPFLSHHDQRWLNREVSPLEIQQALFQMDGRKAPGPDGIPANFYQKFWHITGPSLVHFVQLAFQKGTFPAEMNRTLIALIPRQQPPTSMSHFRPISLCNVAVKVISKVLANRLKPLIPTLTSDCQSSFVPQCQAVDNIIVAQEVVHSLRKWKGKVGGLIAKIDLEKAYDRIEWNFLKQLLLSIGFSPIIVQLILYCISYAHLSLI